MKRDLVYIPLFIFVFSGIVDILTTVYFINYLSINGLVEINPLAVTSDGKLIVFKALILSAIAIVIATLLLLLSLFVVKKYVVVNAKYQNIYELPLLYIMLIFATFCFITMRISTVFLWNPFVLILVSMDIPINSTIQYLLPANTSQFVVAIVVNYFVSIIMTHIWTGCFNYRFLTAKAQSKHKFYAWCYRKGLMIAKT